MEVGLGLNWTEATAQKAINYFAAYLKAGGKFDALAGSDAGLRLRAHHVQRTGGLDRHRPRPDVRERCARPRLGRRRRDRRAEPHSKLPDRESRRSAARDRRVATRQCPPGMSITPIAAGTVVAPGEALPFSITFDPTSSGPVTAQLSLSSNALGGNYLVKLSAKAVSPDGDIRAEVDNNNLGGQPVGAGRLTRDDFVTLRNIGASPLSVTGIRVAHGRGEGRVRLQRVSPRTSGRIIRS